MKQDNNVMKVPICSSKDCKNRAMIFYGDIPVCGDCAMKLHNKKNKLILNQLEDL